MALPSPRAVVTSLINSVGARRPCDDDNGRADGTSDGQRDHTRNGSREEDFRKAFLTLHVSFPNELLPALDLLDRGLVTRLRVLRPGENNGPNEGPTRQDTGRNSALEAAIEPGAPTVADEPKSDNAWAKQPQIYLVRSSQPPPAPHYHSRHSHTTNPNFSSSSSSAAAAAGKIYIVHLATWTCSCPAFTFSAFPAASAQATPSSGLNHNAREGLDVEAFKGAAWRAGGLLTRGEDVPVCKHLLACALAEASRARGQEGVQTRLGVLFEGLRVPEREVGVEELAGWEAGWGD